MRRILAVIIIVTLAIQIAAVGTAFATHTATVVWVKNLKDDPTYPSMPGAPNEYYWNGIAHKWIRFTVTNNGPDPIREVEVVFQKFDDGNSMFNYSQTEQSKTGWFATPTEFGPNKRPTVLDFKTDSQFIEVGETVTFSLFMTQGPGECRHNIDVWTIDSGTTPVTNFYELWMIIDQHAPWLADQINPPNGSIFNQAKNPTIEVTANATDIVPNAPHVSNIKNMTLRIDYNVNTNSPLPNGPSNPTPIPPYTVTMQWDPIRALYHTTLDSAHGLQDEAWHICTVTFYDYAENVNSSQITTFFWFVPRDIVIAKTTDSCFLHYKTLDGKNGIGHVGGNALVERNSGFRPNENITVTFGPYPIGYNVTDNYGRFRFSFIVPELPFGKYTILLNDQNHQEENNQTYFYIIPWMQTVGNNSGYVGDQITVKGTGFDALAMLNVIYRDVSKGTVYKESATEWSNEATMFTWSPHLDNLTLNSLPITTDVNGSFTFTFTIPESYGGNHPVFAQEILTGLRSGWMNNPPTNPPSIFPEAAFVKVKTKVWIDRATTISGQFVNVYATGLPLPEYMNSTFYCATGQTVTESHQWALALDFGPIGAGVPNKYWVFEIGNILNNEFDLAWYNQIYLPFAYWFNHQDPLSPTWSGTLYWKDSRGLFHTGSQFLKVPVLAAGNYTISLYEFNIQTNKDDKQYLATTSVNVIKDPLYVRATAGAIYFNGETVTTYAEIDLDGTATNPTNISFMLYHEDAFVESLDSKAITEGLYVATFKCPQQEGNYFIKVNATKDSGGGILLSGFSATCFTVSPTLNGLNATLTTMNGMIATIDTSVGNFTMNLEDVKATITEIDGNVATISTTIGNLSANINDIKGTVTKIDGNVATITTDIGNVETDVSTVKSQLVTINNNEATIVTSMGTVQTKLENIVTQITQVSADQVMIKTTLGNINGTITSVNDKTTNIQTSIGQITTKTNAIQSQSGNPTAIGLSVIAAVAAIIAALLVFRKLYK